MMRGLSSLCKNHWGRIVRKQNFGFQTRTTTNQAVQQLEMARYWKFWIKEVEVLFNPSRENKSTDQLRSVTAKLICVFVFAYAKRLFSHDAAHFLSITWASLYPLKLYSGPDNKRFLCNHYHFFKKLCVVAIY